MTEVVACCGLDCGKCRAYVATRKRDCASAAEIARVWSNPEEGDYKPEDIWCDGCHSGRLHAFCARCPVRACAKGKGLANCGKCSGYPCGKLESLWGSWIEASPVEARVNLDAVKAIISP
ncbi:MAG: DUF3795 domain-containing protein [Candidatus Bathyarchaeota archaeon]|nr:DUF3795 domain-containing protein [Candidatus Bathyarchaeota archaeon]